MEEKNHRDYIKDALKEISYGSNEGRMNANVLATIALNLVINDFKNVVKKSNKKIDTLNSKIEEYSKSSDKHTNAMKWLTFGLFFIGIIQAIIVFCK